MKVYSGIKGIELPKLQFGSRSDYEKQTQAYEDAVVNAAKRMSSSRIAGEIIRFPVGDGYARYVVVKPTELIHLATGDAWHFQYIGNLKGKDVTEKVKAQKQLEALFKGRAS
jgi:hypothetical protein